VVRFWPDFPEDDERVYDLEKAYGAATNDRQMVAIENPEPNGPFIEWRPIPPSTTRPLIRIVCSHPDHGREQPMVAELWHTDDNGPLFLSRLPGAVGDPPDDPADPFARPVATLSRADRAARRKSVLPARTSMGWEPVPVTIVRIFLEDPTTVEAQLWVKCADHGVWMLDRGTLGVEYLKDRDHRRRGRDTREPTVIGLHTAGAVSSP
jgi:hypothetical protein